MFSNRQCPVCGACRTLPDGEGFPNHPDLTYAARGVLRWCAYAYGIAVPIVAMEA